VNPSTDARKWRDGAEAIKDGLSNVIYRGFANTGIQETRVKRFRDTVTEVQLDLAAALFAHLNGPALREIKHLYLPQFSNMSFVSKVRMFLDPESFVVLDRTIMKLTACQWETVLHKIKKHPTYIPITRNNEMHYENWCKWCRKVAEEYFDSSVIAVDVERGIFPLLAEGRYREAAPLVSRGVRLETDS
jgi:hypothetical protein